MVSRKVNVTAMVDQETFSKLVELKKRTGKTLSALVREAVEEWLRRQEEGEVK